MYKESKIRQKFQQDIFILSFDIVVEIQVVWLHSSINFCISFDHIFAVKHLSAGSNFNYLNTQCTATQYISNQLQIHEYTYIQSQMD